MYFTPRSRPPDPGPLFSQRASLRTSFKSAVPPSAADQRTAHKPSPFATGSFASQKPPLPSKRKHSSPFEASRPPKKAAPSRVQNSSVAPKPTQSKKPPQNAPSLIQNHFQPITPTSSQCNGTINKQSRPSNSTQEHPEAPAASRVFLEPKRATSSASDLSKVSKWVSHTSPMTGQLALGEAHFDFEEIQVANMVRTNSNCM